jgi:hypothetical protein
MNTNEHECALKPSHYRHEPASESHYLCFLCLFVAHLFGSSGWALYMQLPTPPAGQLHHTKMTREKHKTPNSNPFLCALCLLWLIDVVPKSNPIALAHPAARAVSVRVPTLQAHSCLKMRENTGFLALCLKNRHLPIPQL